MSKDDGIRLRHMLEAAREAVSFACGRVRSDLETDRQLVLALVKDIESWAGLPLIAMRNRLVHAYFSINLDIVWQTVQKDLPPLIEKLEKLVPKE